MPEPKTGARPLDNVRVLAAEQFAAGPFGSMLLADLGAEVIKIERPGEGDPGRALNPAVETAQGRTGHCLLRLSRNKKSITLNFQQEAGRELFRQLALKADIVWENFRPGVMDRLGIGWAALRELNPRLIYVSVSGFGHGDIYQSPYRDYPAFDLVGQAMGGLMLRAGRDGDPPAYLGFPLADCFPSVLAAMGAITALYWRTLTGQGRHVDIAMYDAAVMLNEFAIGLHAFTGRVAARGEVGVSAPYHAFRARDGYVVIAVVGETVWERLCAALGRAEWLQDARLKTGVERSRRLDELLRPGIEAWTVEKTKKELADFLNAQGVPCAPVQDVDELGACPHLAARDMLLTIQDPIAGNRAVAGNAIKMTGLPPTATAPPPQVGQHADEVLRTLLELSERELAALRQAGTI